MIDSRTRKIEQYEYKDAAAFLRSLWEIDAAISASGLDYKVRSLHTRKLRKSHERRQAALFTVGMASRIPSFQFGFACVEDQDYDAVVRWHKDNEINYTPIQLKEFVPERINPKATLEKLLKDLRKYTSSPDLVVVVFLNRRFKLDITTLPPIELNLAGLYFLGAATAEKTEWLLIGDMLNSPSITRFQHPR